MRRLLLVAGLLLSGCAHAPDGAQTRATATDANATGARNGAEVSGYGLRLLQHRCQSCHALPDPRKHTRERWVRGIDQMRKRFTLTEADWDTLLAMVPADPAAAISQPR